MNTTNNWIKRSSVGNYECPFCNEAVIMDSTTYNFCPFCGKRIKISTNIETGQVKKKMTKLREVFKDFDVDDVLTWLACVLGALYLFCFVVLIACIVCAATGWQLGLCLCISTVIMLFWLSAIICG